ncbi:MAG: phage portal protein [Pseudomonadota bacterium]
MSFWAKMFGVRNPPHAMPSASVQSSTGGTVIATPQDLEAALRDGDVSDSGQQVTPDKAMRVAAVYACVRIISGAIATLPFQIKRRVDDRTRESVTDIEIWRVISREPNKWQTPSQFRRMLQAHLLLRGNGYAAITRSGNRILELIPLHPDRVELRQKDDLSLEYLWTRPNGGRVIFKQSDVFHLVGLTLDGVRGVTPITYARETIGLSLAQERHGAVQFKNGLNVGGTLTTEKHLGPEGRENIRAAMDEYRSDGDRAGKWMVLEDGLKAEGMSITAEDAQWIESRKFTRSDIAMFFGVPPHMIGDTEKSTSWGSGIEQQSIGFVAYTLEDHLTMWEEASNRDLLPDGDADAGTYFRFNRAALVKGDIKTRWETHVKAMQWGALSPNEVRALEDMNPREGGDIYYDPPNTAGDKTYTGDGDEPPKTP